ncbi:CRISPR-associated endoribonuclease Cas6 [Rhabdonatronobacter sediminivivens]|nr:CRISPR-associated endoribonuclease Cas6 [Rhabdonatronobacter sediminivivens]
MNAALVAGLAAAGIPSSRLVGERAAPWTFGMEGEILEGKGRLVRSVVVSTPDQELAEAMTRLDPPTISVRSGNGDRIDGDGATISVADELVPGTEEVMITFISPFVLMAKKAGREKTVFCENLPTSTLSEVMKAGLEKRAFRRLDLSVSVDPLSARIDGRRKHLTHYRRLKNGRSLILPGFIVPLTLRGNPEDVRFAYLAGFGAKTRAGNGCPALMS